MRRLSAACGWAGLACFLLSAVAAAGSDEPVAVGSEKQLFAGPWTEDGRDGYLVDSMRNVTMRTGEAIATGQKVPLPAPGFVVRDGSLHRLYYGAPGVECDFWDQKLHCNLLRYAESDDGVHWRKPSLGLVEWEGSRDNNILFPNDDFPYAVASVGVNTVFVDPNASGPGDRLKASYKLTPPQETGPDNAMEPLPDGKGKYGFVSADGIHWKRITGKLGTSGDGGFEPFWDGRIGKYVAYSRVKTFDDPRQVDYYHRVYGKRKMNWRARLLRMGRSVSDDFIHWSPEEIVLAPDDVDEANSVAPNRVDFYSLPVIQYTSRAYVAFLSIYSHWEARVKKDGSLSQFPGRADIQLATSRDGIHWSRSPGRTPFIRLGPQGSFWAGMLFVKRPLPSASAPRLEVFFDGWRKVHNDPTRTGQPVRGVAVTRTDGFIVAEAAYTGGELTTKPLVFEGNTLQLNTDTSAGGIVQVEIQDESGRPLEGFKAADADEINGNYLKVAASWNGRSDVSSLAGQPVRLRFLMRDARLYAFRFSP